MGGPPGMGGGPPMMAPPPGMPPGMMMGGPPMGGEDAAFGKSAMGMAPGPKAWRPPGAGMGKGMKGDSPMSMLATTTGKAGPPMGSFGGSPPEPAPAMEEKQPCVMFEMGGCSLGEACPFAQ